MMRRVDTGTELLLCHVEQRVGVITLNNPAKRNALGDELTPALRQTLLAMEADDGVGCVMITGNGDAFCSGGDVGGMSGGSPVEATPEERVSQLIERQVTLTQRIHELDKLTVAALPGPAAGAGLSIALACDLRVASSNAFITTAFRNVGLSGDYGASWFLPRLIGLAKAKELFYTAERVGAEEAARLGLVNKVFPTESFRSDALSYAASLANGPTRTLGRMKVNLNRGMDQDLQASLELEAEHLFACTADSEAREAIRAFMEKRTPDFHGRDPGSEEAG